jgi:hypothetical protein
VHLAYSYPPQAARGPQDGERGGQRGKEQEKEEGEQTPTPGAAPGLRPSGADREEKRRRAGVLTGQPPRGQGQRRSVMTAANTAAMPLDNA